MKRLTLTAAALVLGLTATASAQETGIRPEIRPFMGVYLPTGTQKNLFEDAAMFGVQAAIEVRPEFHMLGTFGYVPGQAKYPGRKDNVQIMQYDVGLEFNLVRSLGPSWLFKPFIGAGAGARTYLYDDSALKNRTCAAGYGALGTEFEIARTAVRLEGRNNVFCFKSPIANVDSKTRNDIGLSLGLAYHFR